MNSLGIELGIRAYYNADTLPTELLRLTPGFGGINYNYS